MPTPKTSGPKLQPKPQPRPQPWAAHPGPFDPDKPYTYAESADGLKASERAVRRWVSEGRLPYLQYPRGRRILGRDLNAFLAQCRVDAR